jgi:transposase
VGGTLEQRGLAEEVEALRELLRDRDRRIAERDEVIAEKDETIRHLRREYDILRRIAFGPKTDKRPLPANASAHPMLFPFLEQAERVARANAAEGTVEILPPKAPEKKGRRPRKWPADAPVVRTTFEVPEEDRVCECGHPLHEIGEDSSRELERFTLTVIHEIIRKKYSCRSCESGVRMAPGPDRVIDKGLLGPNFLAQVIVDRFGNHMPYHRLEKQYASEGLDLSRSVLQRSMARVAELLEPISEQIKRDVLSSDVIHTDDTPVVIANATTGGSRKGRAWIYLDREGSHWYHFTQTRERDGPARILEDFQGYLQADAYGGYDQLYSPDGATEVACWAHVRRKFVDAEGTDPETAKEAIDMIRNLFAIERQARQAEFTPEQLRDARQEYALPILQEFRGWLDRILLQMLPKSAIARAATYAHNQWDALMRYVEDGRLSIDNNAAERALRPFAVGRKNWLFFQNDTGGKTASILMSLLMSAKAIGLNPTLYFRDVLLRVARCSDVGKLTPRGWKEHFAAEVESKRDEFVRRFVPKAR